MGMKISMLYPKIVKWVNGNKIDIAIFIVMFINLAYMHYEVFFSRHSHVGLRPYYDPIVFMIFDVLWTILLFSLITLRNKTATYITSYILLFVIEIGNIVYSRFFNSYLTLSALGQADNFKELWWLPYVDKAFEWTDLLLVVNTIIFCFLILKNKKSPDRINLKLLCVCILTFGLFHMTIGTKIMNYTKLSSYLDYKGWYSKKIGHRFQREFIYDQDRKISRCGIIRTQIICNILNLRKDYTLSTDEVNLISEYLTRNNGKLKTDQIIKGTPNVVFVLIESWLSICSNMKINGVEVTPNINKLLKENSTYYNGNVISNRGNGTSSDAQISYFTGNLPQKHETSFSHILKNKCIAFPQLLRDIKGYSTYLTLPTEAHFWHQNELNPKYGIDSMHALGWCCDKDVFTDAITWNKEFKRPYLHIILTISTHAPYEEYLLKEDDKFYPFSYTKEHSKEFIIYLKQCYYTDYYLGKYIEYLKSQKEYDNTVFIITSDHEPVGDVLNTNIEELNNNNLPLIITNINKSLSMYNGEMNQIDLYPTLLDLFSIETHWRGVGKSILRDDYTYHISDDTKTIANKILQGDYLKYVE